MAIWTGLSPDNPVLIKEMRVRMRGARAYWILLGYLGFLSLVLLLNYLGWLNQVQSRGVGASEASRIGAEMFNWIMITQVFLVLFITPAITSGSITIEKEQRTLDMLTMTRLSRRSIIVGKLLSAVAFTALLLVSSLPLVSICFMLGSVDPGMVVSSYLMLLVGSFLVGTMGLMWSSIARSTSAAVLYTYATLILPVFLGFGAFATMQSSGSDVAFQLFRAIGETWFGGRFFGLRVPMGTGFAVFSLLGGFVLAAIATSNLESLPERRAPLLRGLTVLLLGVELLSLYLWWLQAWYNRAAQAVQIQVDPPLTVLILAAILLMLLVPVFATGDLRREEAGRFSRYLAAGWTPQGLRQGRMASGLPFLLLLTLFAMLLYAFSFVLVGQAKDIAHSVTSPNPIPSAVPPTAPMVPPGFSAPNAVPPQAAAKASADTLAGDFPQAALVLLVSVGGFALLCMFFSVAFRNRWVALFLAYLFLIWIWVAPELARMKANTYSGTPPGPSIHLYYFNPIQALVQMTSSRGNYFDTRPLLLDTTPMWQATTYLWLCVGGLSLALMLMLASRRTT